MLAVMLMILAALAYGTWSSLQGPAFSAGRAIGQRRALPTERRSRTCERACRVGRTCRQERGAECAATSEVGADKFSGDANGPSRTPERLTARRRVDARGRSSPWQPPWGGC